MEPQQCHDCTGGTALVSQSGTGHCAGVTAIAAQGDNVRVTVLGSLPHPQGGPTVPGSAPHLCRGTVPGHCHTGTEGARSRGHCGTTRVQGDSDRITWTGVGGSVLGSLPHPQGIHCAGVTVTPARGDGAGGHRRTCAEGTVPESAPRDTARVSTGAGSRQGAERCPRWPPREPPRPARTCGSGVRSPRAAVPGSHPAFPSSILDSAPRLRAPSPGRSPPRNSARRSRLWLDIPPRGQHQEPHHGDVSPSRVTAQLSHHFCLPASVSLTPAGTRGDTGSSWSCPGWQQGML
ncbi:uncharacterized protein LOC127060242 [Serinus canaria]|uniref:uncharacterized protein LOC127060242 n=1 Tax=Serinus canaria TaxID=9135 RepID=UPI0021CCD8F7|nr:uncharacterized protein LOC127060242 [Serinus canaria]